MIVSENSGATQLAVLPPTENRQDGGAGNGAGDEDGFQMFGEDGFTFLDFLDIINPLQHIPLISTLYRNLTGDTIDPAPRVAGGALFGGPIGAVVSLIDVIINQSTGKDFGQHVMAMFGGETPAQDGGYRSAAAVSVDGPYAIATAAEMALLEAEAKGMKVAAAAPAPASAPASAPAPYAALTGAELALLKAEAEAMKAASANAAPPPTVVAFADRPHAATTTAAVAGAAAREGGWFSDVMLTALARYQDGARLSSVPPPPGVDISY